jgi:hypothetical protein
MRLVNIRETRHGVLIGECPNCGCDQLLADDLDEEEPDPLDEARTLFTRVLESTDGSLPLELEASIDTWLERNGGAT